MGGGARVLAGNSAASHFLHSCRFLPMKPLLSGKEPKVQHEYLSRSLNWKGAKWPGNPDLDFSNILSLPPTLP